MVFEMRIVTKTQRVGRVFTFNNFFEFSFIEPNTSAIGTIVDFDIMGAG
jgi:hypothetical protein